MSFSSTLQPKAFQSLKPIGGVRARPSSSAWAGEAVVTDSVIARAVDPVRRASPRRAADRRPWVRRGMRETPSPSAEGLEAGQNIGSLRLNGQESLLAAIGPAFGVSGSDVRIRRYDDKGDPTCHPRSGRPFGRF